MKRFSLLLLCMLLLSAFAACDAGQIEDTNGADTALATLGEEEIFRKSLSYVSYGSVTGEKDGVVSYRVKKLSGVYKVSTFHIGKESTVQLDLSLVLTAGNLRAVLLCDGVFVQDIPLGTEQSIQLEKAKGDYEIRLAGESAALEFSCKVKTLK